MGSKELVKHVAERIISLQVITSSRVSKRAWKNTMMTIINVKNSRDADREKFYQRTKTKNCETRKKVENILNPST